MKRNFIQVPNDSRLVQTLPCITVYMSSLTNMAIALDRYRVIVKPESLQVSTRGAWLLLPVIFVSASALSAPISYKTKLVSLKQFLVISKSSERIMSKDFEKIKIIFMKFFLIISLIKYFFNLD